MSEAGHADPPPFSCQHGAPYWETLEMLATRVRIPKHFVRAFWHQASISHSLAFREHGQLRAVLHFVPDQSGLPEVELCAFFGATAPTQMLRVIREAQLTLAGLHQNGVAAIMVVRRHDERQGHRLARLTGFHVETDDHPHGTIYRWRPS
jgi:hypothetical protein